MENGAVFQKSAWRSIFSLCIPALASIVVMMFYNMADLYFVGWLDDYAQVAAVSLAGPVFSVLMGISTMIGNGGCTKIAQALGAGGLERVRGCSALCVWASIVSGAVFAAVCAIFCDPLLRLLGANAEMWDDTKSYVLIMALGAPIVLLNHSLGSALRGEGEVAAGLVGGMVSTVSNIILDPIFILVLKLGAGGAAAATVLGNAIALGYYMIYKARSHGRCIIELRPRYARDLRLLVAMGAAGGAGAGPRGRGRYFHRYHGVAGADVLQKIDQKCAKKRTSKRKYGYAGRIGWYIIGVSRTRRAWHGRKDKSPFAGRV